MFKDDNALLFHDGDLPATLANMLTKAADEVGQLSQAQLSTTPEDDVVAHVTAKLQVDPLALYEDRMTAIKRETQVDVSGDWRRAAHAFGERGPVLAPGTEVTIRIPYTGDKSLWKLQPSRYRMRYPRGTAGRPDADGIGELRIILEVPTGDSIDEAKRLLDDQLDDIRFFIEAQGTDIEQFHQQLPGAVRSALATRKARVQEGDQLLTALGIPLETREGEPDLKPIKVQRQLVKPLPAVPKRGAAPEYGLTAEQYQHILEVIRHAGRTFETTPKTYAVHDEEELRDIVLANLNTHYKGLATGETFRNTGKTDVRLELENRNAFVAECKVWRGEAEIPGALDQLTSYMTWRDCKGALIVFNKAVAGFSELLEKLPAAVATHPRCRKDLGQQEQGEWRYIFASGEDEAREITVQVFLFNVYYAPAAKGTRKKRRQ